MHLLEEGERAILSPGLEADHADLNQDDEGVKGVGDPRRHFHPPEEHVDHHQCEVEHYDEVDGRQVGEEVTGEKVFIDVALLLQLPLDVEGQLVERGEQVFLFGRL